MAETLSTCRFAQRMGQVQVDAVQNGGGLAGVHGNLFKLDPMMQQYLQVRALVTLVSVPASAVQSISACEPVEVCSCLVLTEVTVASWQPCV